MNGTHNHGPLAGLGAGAAAVLFAFGVLALAWHRVAGQVSMGIAVLVYVFIAALAVVFGAAAVTAFLWVRERIRHPELLSGRRAGRAAGIRSGSGPDGPDAIGTARPAAIEPPRVYLNLTDDQLAAIMRQPEREE